jgi:hypothetical protein
MKSNTTFRRGMQRRLGFSGQGREHDGDEDGVLEGFEAMCHSLYFSGCYDLRRARTLPHSALRAGSQRRPARFRMFPGGESAASVNHRKYSGETPDGLLSFALAGEAATSSAESANQAGPEQDDAAWLRHGGTEVRVMLSRSESEVLAKAICRSSMVAVSIPVP